MNIIDNEQQSFNESEGMYYYNRPINTYVFIFAFSLSMIVVLSSDGKFTWMGFFVSVLWGLLALGGGNLLWAFVGDMLHPYIHRDRGIYLDEEEPVTTDPVSPAPNGSFNRVVNKAISDGKLWARGMSVLEPEEESELRAYFKKRWDDESISLGSMSPSLISKLQERGLADSGELTIRGQRTIPHKSSYERVDGQVTM